jgi:hypothetical protein
MEQVAVVADPFNRTEERALINIVPKGFADAILLAYGKRPELFGLEEHGLNKLLRGEKASPNPTDNRLRMKFWMEYDIAQSEGKRMNMKSVCAGVCSYEYLHMKYLTEPTKMAWLLTPPANYLVVTEEALQVGLEMLRTYLEVSAVTGEAPREKLDTKVAEIQLKIVALLDTRVKGAVVQKTMNLHASVPRGAVAEISETKSMEVLEKRMRALEQRRKQSQGKIVDVAVVSPEQSQD